MSKFDVVLKCHGEIEQSVTITAETAFVAVEQSVQQLEPDSNQDLHNYAIKVHSEDQPVRTFDYTQFI